MRAGGTAPQVGRIEFAHLDGIRGIAATAVVLYHAYLFTGRTEQAEAELPIIGAVVGWGYLGVPVFIVLSGFLLMLPLLHPEGLRFRGGVARFFKRRARRILPPYYAALALSLVLIWAVPMMEAPGGTAWDSKVPVTVPSVISHLLLLHDLSPAWILNINGPLWSVAVEWQIYICMPLLLVPLWRRLPAPLILVLLAAVTVLVPAVTGFGAMVHPWLVMLFAAGMLAAQVAMGHRESRSWTGLAAAALVAVLMLTYVLGGDAPSSGLWLSETIVGLVTATGLAWSGARAAAGRTFPMARFLASRPLVYAGTVSYSVYLLHSPLLALGNLLLLPSDLPLEAHWAIMTFVIAPFAVLVCWGFYQAVERHFQNTRQAHVQQAASTDSDPQTARA
jgi:peptidoglycan/LPS O-acetylase OafA/YrhL